MDVKKHIILLSLLLFSFMARAQNNAFGIRDATYEYYTKCENVANDSLLLPMLDTLSRLAIKDGDVMMQAIAMCSRIDYYMQVNNLDSIIFWVNRVKAFSKKTKQPKYYYLGWERLISYYINTHQFSSSQKELSLMLKEAEKDNNQLALATSYSLLARLFSSWGMEDKAIENYYIYIKFLEEDNPDDPNLFGVYQTTASLFMDYRQYDNAKIYLDKASHLAAMPSQSNTLNCLYATYYLYQDDVDAAEKYLHKVKGSHDLEAISGNSFYFKEELLYLEKKGDYRKALKLCDLYLSHNKTTPPLNYLKDKMTYLALLDQYREAYLIAANILSIKDSLFNSNSIHEFNDVVANSEINQISLDRARLEQKINNNRFDFLTIILISVIVFLFVLVFFLIKTYRLNKKLKESVLIKTNFLQNLSHEIRTPLNSIEGYAQIIMSTPDMDEQTKSFAKIIISNSKALLRQIENAINASDNNISRSKRLYDINQCCKDAINSMNDFHPGHVPIYLKPLEGETFFLLDLFGVRQVISNLLDNACLFTKEGKIIIKVRHYNKRLRISVSDTGIGIPLDKQDMIFDSFYKINSFSPGLGLGLTTSKNISESMDGHLEIDKLYTIGCRMVFTFPVSK